jgi:glyoxylate reductase
MPKVVLGDYLPAMAGQQLRTVLPEGVDFEAVQEEGEEELARCGRGAEVLVTVRVKVDTRVLALLPSVRFIQTLGVGYENLDRAAIEAAGLVAANNPGFNASTVAEHTIMLMLVLLNRFVPAHDATRSGAFPMLQFIGANQASLRELGDETVGLIGLGNIGRAVAERLMGFKTGALYYARHRADDGAEARLGVRYAPLDELLARASIVSLHLPASAETRHMIGAAELAQMQPGAFLINTSRGELIDETALREAVTGGRLAGAGLDVIQNEPGEVHVFADLPQVIVTPHSAGVSRSSMPRALIKQQRISCAFWMVSPCSVP